MTIYVVKTNWINHKVISAVFIQAKRCSVTMLKSITNLKDVAVTWI